MIERERRLSAAAFTCRWSARPAAKAGFGAFSALGRVPRLTAQTTELTHIQMIFASQPSPSPVHLPALPPTTSFANRPPHRVDASGRTLDRDQEPPRSAAHV